MRDQLTRIEHGFDMRRCARKPVKLADGDAASPAAGFERNDGRIQRAHRNRHVGRMRGDAMIARAEDRMIAGEAAQGRASRARLALVARRCRVVEIIAARALEQIAARGRLIPELRRGSRKQRPRQYGIVGAQAGIGGQIAVRAPSAPMDSPPASVGAMSDKFRRLISTSFCGVSISSFIRSSRLVPPAMNFVPGPPACMMAASAVSTRA